MQTDHCRAACFQGTRASIFVNSPVLVPNKDRLRSESIRVVAVDVDAFQESGRKTPPWENPALKRVGGQLWPHTPKLDTFQLCRADPVPWPNHIGGVWGCGDLIG